MDRNSFLQEWREDQAAIDRRISRAGMEPRIKPGILHHLSSENYSPRYILDAIRTGKVDKDEEIAFRDTDEGRALETLLLKTLLVDYRPSPEDSKVVEEILRDKDYRIAENEVRVRGYLTLERANLGEVETVMIKGDMQLRTAKRALRNSLMEISEDTIRSIQELSSTVESSESLKVALEEIQRDIFQSFSSFVGDIEHIYDKIGKALREDFHRRIQGE